MKMDKQTVQKLMIAAVLVVIALISALGLAKLTADPAFHAASIAALDEKKLTVTELTAAAAAGSVAVSAIPGDATTPIANQIAEMATYLLIVVGAILLEKFLLTMTCLVTFQYLIPIACVLGIIWLFWRKAVLLQLALRLTVFGLVICLIVPASIQVSNLVEATFDTQKAVASLQQAADDAVEQQDASAEESEGGLGGWLSQVGETISGGVSSAVEQAEQMLSQFVDAIAVLVITTCVLPLAVLLFFAWVTKIIFGISGSIPVGKAAGAVHHRFQSKRTALKAAATQKEDA